MAITNPAAGSYEAAAVDGALDVLRAAGIEVDEVATENEDELDQALSDRAGRDLIVVGGDGSLHAVVAALAERDELGDPVIGLIPLGTGNDFARGVTLPLEPAEAAAAVADRRGPCCRRDHDDGGGIVINAVHLGVGAEAGREANRLKPRLGKLGYPLGALIAGVRTEGLRVSVEVDRAPVVSRRRRVLQVGIANAAYVGGGTELAPDADPTDGLLDVVVSFAVAPLSRLAYALRLNRGTHDDRRDVHSLRGTRVTVRGEPFSTNADGEVDGPWPERTWTLRPGALRMLLP